MSDRSRCGAFLVALVCLLVAVTWHPDLAAAAGIAGPPNEETAREQAAALAELQAPAPPRTFTAPSGTAAVTHPLFVAVDAAAIPAYQIDPATANAIQAFVGAAAWGAAFDVANNRVLFNDGSTLYQWPVGGVVSSLGTMTDAAGGSINFVGLACHNGTLYGVRNISNEAVYTIDTTTRVATVLIDYPDGDVDLGGLAADPTTGELYATNDDTDPFGSGLFRINADASVTKIADYPAGQTDIDGLAISTSRVAYLVTDEPGMVYVYDLVAGAYQTPFANPWTTALTFSAGTWIWEVDQPAITLTKTVGTVPGVCAVTDAITVPAGTTVYYCYQAQNTGTVTFDLHNLEDSVLGTLLANFPYLLAPGAFSPQVIVPATPTATVTNTATWTAVTATGGDQASAQASATVTVLIPNIDVSPASLASTQNPDTVTQQALNIGNTGAGDLIWEISEEPLAVPAPLTPPPPVAHFDSQTAVETERSGVEPASANASRPRDPAARALARRMLLSTGLLLVPDSTNDRVMALDPTTGNVVDADFIPTNAVMGTAINAILNASGDGILVSDQTGDVVHEFDLDGNYIGVFAPSGGANTAILDNIRGIALDAGGNLLVTVGSGANASSIARFDTNGAYLANFVAIGAGGLASPFDVYGRTADWLVASIDSDNVLRYDLTGASLGVLATTNNFPEQIAEAGNGNVLVGNFSGTQEGVIELTSAGALVGVYNPATLGGYRGVHELPNGNILTTTGTGVHEINRSGALVESKITGLSGRFLEYVVLATECTNPSDVPWLSATPTNGTTSAGATTPVQVGFDSTGLAAGTYSANLCVLSNDPDPGPGNGTGLVVVPVNLTVEEPPAPAITLVKTVGTTAGVCAATAAISVSPGTTVYYCYTVTNTGNVTLTLHDLADDQLGTIFSGLNYALTPGSSVNTVAAGLSIPAVINTTTTNTGTWTAYNQSPIDGVQAQASATVTVVFEPSISLVKTVGTVAGVCAATTAITVDPGTTVYYCYTVTNTGNLTLNLHNLTDDRLGTLFSGLSYALTPGSSVNTVAAGLSIPAVIDTTTTNTGTWTAYNAGPVNSTQAQASATVTVVANPSVSLVKTVGTVTGVCAATSSITVTSGTTVYYCYTVTNTGNVALNLHDLVDDQLGTLFTGLNYALAPGSSVNTVAAGLSIPAVITTTTTNTGTWTAYNAGPVNSTQAQASATVTALQPANVTGTKTVTGTYVPHGHITYTVLLTNAGPGPQPDAVGDEFSDLLPSTLTATGATASSGTALLAGNLVTWNGSIPAGHSVTITITATINLVAGGTTISNQGTISYDSDGDGTNNVTRLTDDPVPPGASDPTVFLVTVVEPIPTLDWAGLAALILLLGGAAILLLRRLS
ncbi:MAG: hypothetical protein MUF10_09740 [Thermoanaerobaculaceae bacterium]|jgi:hypothetical protein|nr:hypothetical protein [Thermoanaerobaculaceae bacterium]